MNVTGAKELFSLTTTTEADMFSETNLNKTFSLTTAVETFSETARNGTLSQTPETTSELLSETTSELLSETTSEMLSETTSEMLSETTSDLLSETTSEMLSETTSELLSETTSDLLSVTTADMLSETTSDLLSETTSEMLSETNTTETFLIPTVTSSWLEFTTAESFSFSMSCDDKGSWGEGETVGSDVTGSTSSGIMERSLLIYYYFCSYPPLLIVALSLLFLLTFVLNVVVGVALYKARRLQPAMRVLLFNLAVSDAIAGLVNVYHFVVNRFIKFYTIECILRYGLVIELSTVTMVFISILSLDRVVALTYSLRYDEFVTVRRLWIVSGLVWVVSLIFPLVGLAGVDSNTEYCVYQLFLPTYSFIFFGFSVAGLMAVVAGLNVFTLRKTMGHIGAIANSVVGRDRAEAAAAMNRKATVTSALIVAPFLVLCGPMYGLFIGFAFVDGLRESLGGLIAVSVCLGLSISNSLVNPFIYVWRSREVRQEVRRVLCRGFALCRKN